MLINWNRILLCWFMITLACGTNAGSTSGGSGLDESYLIKRVKNLIRKEVESAVSGIKSSSILGKYMYM